MSQNGNSIHIYNSAAVSLWAPVPIRVKPVREGLFKRRPRPLGPRGPREFKEDPGASSKGLYNETGDDKIARYLVASCLWTN